MIEKNRRVLVVDDNRAIHEDFRKILCARPTSDVESLEAELLGAEPETEAFTFEVASAYQGAEGVERVREARAAGQPFALALVDMRMPPGLDGVETIARMWEHDPDLQVVICTAYSDASWSEIRRRFGATDRLLILKKPFDLVEVCQLAFSLTEKWQLAAEARLRMAELDEKRAELAAGLALAHAVQEASMDGLLVVGPDRRVAMASQRFLDMWRIPAHISATGDDERLLGHVIDQLADAPEFMARVHALYEAPELCAADEVRLRDGRVFERWSSPVRGQGGAIHGRLWCFRDVTERRRIELDRAVVTERMAQVGRLAAGVGHEINNPLTYALANVDELIERTEGGAALEPDAEVTESLAQIRDGLMRIRVIVRDLQSLARSDEREREVDLAETVEQALQIAANEVRHRAPIVRRYEPVPPVLGSATRLGQVFLNLIINAAHAIPVGSAGKNQIEVTIRSTETESIVEVTDTGTGIAPEHIQQIFDPFFTTKAVGAGSGLGLSISREIVLRHNGTLTAQSTLGVGTTMTVRLPHSPGLAEAASPPVPARPARHARLLVIDDEPLIRHTLQRSLGARHKVTVAALAREALDRIEAGETFDLILCDLMMPEVSGIELHDQLAREHPDLVQRMIFMTGGAFTPSAKQFLEQMPNRRIDKPFSNAEIGRIVDGFLEAWGAPATS